MLLIMVVLLPDQFLLFYNSTQHVLYMKINY